jgi:hypothetical protein
MNLFQSLNVGMSIATMVALLGCLAKIPIPFSDWPLSLGLFLTFFVLARLKICLDDHKYFGETTTANRHFKIGFVVGFVSWLFWALAAWSVGQLQGAYFLCGIALTISTLWIIVVALRTGAYKEQYYWIFTNAGFVVLLWAAYSRNQPTGDYLTWAFLSATIIIVLIDFVISDSVPEVTNAAPAGLL